MQPQQGNRATMIQEMGTSFHYLNRRTWAIHVRLASLASRLKSSHLDCAKPPKSPLTWPSRGFCNPNHLSPLHVDDDFLWHPNGLVPTPLLLHLPNLVCNHLVISLILDDVGVALSLGLHVTCSKSRLQPSQASSSWNHGYLEKVGLCSSCLERCPLVPHRSCPCPSSLPTSLGAISLLA
jgi:hypothetical protein